jgi:hypothetical protein
MYKLFKENILSTRFQTWFSTLSTEFSTLLRQIALYPKYNMQAAMKFRRAYSALCGIISANTTTCMVLPKVKRQMM